MPVADYPLEFPSRNGDYEQDATNDYYRICDRYRLCWRDIAYRPGELRAVAYRNGRKIGETRMKTAGKAVRLAIERDAFDDRMFHVSAVDADGVSCPNENRMVSFSLNGPGRIVAVGNGDARGLGAFAGVAAHRMYYGSVTVLVECDLAAADRTVLTVRSNGIGGDQIVCHRM